MDITPKSIVESIDECPPFQQKNICNSFVGLDVIWSLELASINEPYNGFVRIHAYNLKMIRPVIIFSVSLDKYPELKSIKFGENIKVKGKINEVDQISITLNECELFFPQQELNKIKTGSKMTASPMLPSKISIRSKILYIAKEWLKPIIFILGLAGSGTLIIRSNFVNVVNGNNNKSFSQISNGSGDNVAGDKIVYGEKDTIRQLETLETGKNVSELPSNIYFFVNSLRLKFYYNDLAQLNVRRYKSHDDFQVQKINNQVVIIGYINSENFSKISSINKTPTLITVFPFPRTDYQKIIGIPLESISKIEQRNIEESPTSSVGVLDLVSEDIQTNVNYIK